MSGANFGRLAISLSLGLASLSMACSQGFAKLLVAEYILLSILKKCAQLPNRN